MNQNDPTYEQPRHAAQAPAPVGSPEFEEEVKDLFLAADEAQRSGDDAAVESLVDRLQAAAERAETAETDESNDPAPERAAADAPTDLR